MYAAMQKMFTGAELNPGGDFSHRAKTQQLSF